MNYCKDTKIIEKELKVSKISKLIGIFLYVSVFSFCAGMSTLWVFEGCKVARIIAYVFLGLTGFIFLVIWFLFFIGLKLKKKIDRVVNIENKLRGGENE